VFKSLVRPVAEVQHPVSFSRRISKRHACLDALLILGNSSRPYARRYPRRSKLPLNPFQPAARERVVQGRKLPVGLVQKQLTTTAVTRLGNQALVGQVYNQMAVRELNEKDGRHRAFIALGSNMGDRLQMIERACKLLEHSGEISILRTSSLWETKAMYVENQADFLNGVCEVETLFKFTLIV
jgi:hypothetical protein